MISARLFCVFGFCFWSGCISIVSGGDQPLNFNLNSAKEKGDEDVSVGTDWVASVEFEGWYNRAGLKYRSSSIDDVTISDETVLVTRLSVERGRWFISLASSGSILSNRFSGELSESSLEIEPIFDNDDQEIGYTQLDTSARYTLDLTRKDNEFVAGYLGKGLSVFRDSVELIPYLFFGFKDLELNESVFENSFNSIFTGYANNGTVLFGPIFQDSTDPSRFLKNRYSYSGPLLGGAFNFIIYDGIFGLLRGIQIRTSFRYNLLDGKLRSIGNTGLSSETVELYNGDFGDPDGITAWLELYYEFNLNWGVGVGYKLQSYESGNSNEQLSRVLPEVSSEGLLVKVRYNKRF